MSHPHYRVEGKRVPSVTTILGKFKDPGALMYWSWGVANSVLEEAVNLLEKSLDARPQETLLVWDQQAEIRKFLRSNPLDRANFRNESARAASAGTYAHGLVEQWIHGDSVARSNLARKTARSLAVEKKCQIEIAQRSIQAFQSFLRWAEGNKLQFEEAEISLTSEKHRFGGTIDCYGWLDEKLILFDWKTSKALYADYLLQLAAYGLLWNENYEDQVDQYHLVRFDKETADFHHHQFDDLSDAAEMFLLLRRCYDLEKQVAKRAG